MDDRSDYKSNNFVEENWNNFFDGNMSEEDIVIAYLVGNLPFKYLQVNNQKFIR